MYSQRTTFFPAFGKAPELRPILEERAKQRQAQGIRTSLATAAFGAEGPALVMTAQFDDLSALEASRGDPPAADPRIAPLLRQTVRSELFEILLAAPVATTPAKYLQRITNTPLPGKGRELQDIVVERAKGRQSEGIRTGVSIQAAGPASGTVVTTIVFGNLAEYEKLRARNQTDASFQQYGQRLAGLSSRTPIVELLEIVVPYPPRQ